MPSFRLRPLISLLRPSFQKNYLKQSASHTYEYSEKEEEFWNQESLKSGYDPRIRQKSSFWKDFFFEQTLSRQIAQKGGNLSLFEANQKRFWSKEGRWVKDLQINAQEFNFEGLRALNKWLPNLKSLSIHPFWIYEPFFKTNTHSFSLALEGFPQLKELDLSKCSHLDKKILPQNHPSLASLTVSDAQSISVDFFLALRQLEQLNQLSVIACPGLESTHLHYLPSSITSLNLSRSGNNIKPTALIALPQSIKKIALNGFKGVHAQEIKTFSPKMEEIFLDCCPLEEQDLCALSSFFHLNKLSLRNCKEHVITQSIKHLPNQISYLDIGENPITNPQSLRMIKEFVHLKELHLDHCPKLTKADFIKLELPPLIEHVWLTHAGCLPDHFFASLEKLPLKTLGISRCQVQSKNLSHLPHGLNQLDLSYNPSLNDESLNCLHDLHKLSLLNLNQCDQIRGFGFSFLPQSLRKLSLRGCSRISGKSLSLLPRLLEELHLDQCDLIEDKDLENIPRSIYFLSLTSCKKLSDKSFDSLLEIPYLSHIHIQHCPLITAQGISRFIENGFSGTIVLDAKKQPCLPLLARKRTITGSSSLHIISECSSIGRLEKSLKIDF